MALFDRGYWDFFVPQVMLTMEADRFHHCAVRHRHDEWKVWSWVEVGSRPDIGRGEHADR